MQRTLISVSRINEFGFEARLGKLNPHIYNLYTGEVIPLRKEKGMYIMDMWIWVPEKDPGQGFGGQP